MSAIKTEQVVSQIPIEVTNDAQIMNVLGIVSLLVISLVVWIFNKHVNDIAKRFERYDKALESRFNASMDRANSAHDKIENHVHEFHLDRNKK